MGGEYGSIYVACYVLKEGALFDMVHNGHLVKILHCCTEQAITEALEKLELHESFTKEDAIFWVDHMENSDGTTGAQWP